MIQIITQKCFSPNFWKFECTFLVGMTDTNIPHLTIFFLNQIHVSKIISEINIYQNEKKEIRLTPIIPFACNFCCIHIQYAINAI